MSKHVLRRICFCGPLAVVLVAGFLAASYPRPAAKGSGITRANFDRIVEGMTQQDVEEIFGCPPGDYTNGESISFRWHIRSYIRKKTWTGYEGDIDVQFSREDGKVVDKFFMETALWPKPTWLDRIKGLCHDVFSAGS
jgi:hypothetical protein